jgi:tetraacyldisaccharide 4'-kinase
VSGVGVQRDRRDLKALALWPVAMLSAMWLDARRRGYAVLNLLRPRLRVPVVVAVGSATLGGRGKTPFVIWLANQLRAQGLRPGIVRVDAIVGGSTPVAVRPTSTPEQATAEAVVLARRARCPVYAGPRAGRAARALVKAQPCDVLIAVGPLYDYRFRRDIEVAVIDGRQQLGNALPRPAGPLYEPLARLQARDFVIVNGRATGGQASMGLRAAIAVNVLDTQHTQPLDGFRHQRVHAVTAMRAADRFFDMLRAHGIDVTPHEFPDDHVFEPGELGFGEDQAVLMTERDAVQCRALAASNWWFVPVSAVPDTRLGTELIRAIQAVRIRHSKRSKKRG